MNELRFRAFVLRSILLLLRHAALSGRVSCGEIAHLEREGGSLLREVER